MGEAIKKMRDNLNEFWQGLDKGQRIRIIIISALSAILIISIGVFSAMPRYQVLYPNLDAKDAGEIRNKLKEMNIPVKVDGTTLMVPKDKVDEARISLAMEGLPQNDFVFPDMLKSSFNDTSEDKKQKYVIYMQNLISNGIKSLNGVEWSQVNIFIPEDSVFVLESNRLDSSASVIVKMKPGFQSLDQTQVNGIVQYISKSVKGLKAENISIIDDTGRSLKSEGGGFNAQVNTQMEMQEATRLSIQNSVRKFLESVFGIHNVNVMTTVKLNFNNEVENQKVFEPVGGENNTGIIRNMEDIKKEWVNGGTGGIPGTDSNIEINTYPQVDASKSNYNEASSIVNYEINETQKQIIREQGNIDTFSISVLINKSALKEEVLANIDDLKGEVKDLVKFATQGLSLETPSSDGNIYIQVMDFDTTFKDQIESTIAEEAKQKRNQMLVMLGAAIAAVLVFAASMIVLLKRRKAYSSEEDIEVALSKIEEAAGLDDIETEDKNEVKKKVEKFIAQKPEQVAQLLKTWLNEE